VALPNLLVVRAINAIDLNFEAIQPAATAITTVGDFDFLNVGQALHVHLPPRRPHIVCVGASTGRVVGGSISIYGFGRIRIAAAVFLHSRL